MVQPLVGTELSVASQTVEIAGTVLRIAFACGIVSTPSAISSASWRVAPFLE